MNNSAIAIKFSNGEFKDVYDFIASDAEWIVVEENHFNGKKAIIENCEQVSEYFKSVKVDFKTLNVISNKNKVAINGTAEFFRDNKRISFVSSCDLYEFNQENQIQNITSYCIQSK